MHTMQVKDVMTRQYPHIELGVSLTDVVNQLQEYSLTGVPVVDKQNRLKGFVSEQDCIRKLISASYFCDSNIKVEEVMSQEPLFIKPDMGLVDLAQKFVTGKPKIYPVVEDDTVVAVVSRSDVMAALVEQLNTCVPV